MLSITHGRPGGGGRSRSRWMSETSTSGPVVGWRSRTTWRYNARAVENVVAIHR